LTAKDQYIAYALQHAVPLFFKPYWLDLFGSNWQVIQEGDKDETVYFIYRIEKKFNFKIIRNAYLTPYSGFIFCHREMPDTRRQQAVTALLKRLPASHELQIDLHPDTGTQFEAQGFTFSIKKTNILDISQMTDVYDAYKPALKRQIKKATKLVGIEEKDDITLFYKLYQSTFQKQDKKAVIPFAAFKEVWQTCKKMNCGRLLFATDQQQQVHAALLLTYDEQSAYYLAGGTDAAHYGSGAMSYLMHYAIEKASGMNKKYFDFEGSMLPGVNRFFKNYGPDEKLYLSMTKNDSRLLQVIKKIRKG